MKWIAQSLMGCLAIAVASQLAHAQYTMPPGDYQQQYSTQGEDYQQQYSTQAEGYQQQYAPQDQQQYSAPVENNQGASYQQNTAPVYRTSYNNACAPACTPAALSDYCCVQQPSCRKKSCGGFFDNTCVGGWIQGGWMGNTRGHTGNNPYPGNYGQGTTGNTDITLNQAWIFAEKCVNKYSCGWDWGWRADFAYGSDMPGWQTYNDIGDLTRSNHHNTQSFDYGWLTSGGGTNYNGDGSIMYGAAMPQLYATLKYNRLSAKLGRFLSPMGYESIMAPDDRNYFYSHSYAFNYLSPHTMTGIMGEYAFNRKFSLLLGWSNGWDCGPSFNDRQGSMVNAGIQYRPNRCFELTYMYSGGDVFDQRDNVPGLKPNGDYHSLVLDWRLTNRLRYGLESTYANFSADAFPQDMRWWTVANYLAYDFNCCWAAALRFEYVDMNSDFYSLCPFMFDGGYVLPEGNIYSLTLGVTWRPCASRHLAIRPELRYDWVNSGGRTRDLLSGGAGVTYTF